MNSLLRPALLETGALLTLGLIVLIAFRDGILFGLVAFQADTLNFYYPLERWFAEEFKAGRLPLWNPYVFGGYPIFADGELGPANPLHWFLLKVLPFEGAYIWLRVSAALVAAGSMFALCRALGLGRLASMLGGIVFSLGSFFVAQQHHENMLRTVAWTPLALACVEWGLHQGGWRRHLFLTAAALAVAMAALGVHPQGLVMVLLATSSFIAFRVLSSQRSAVSTQHPALSTEHSVPRRMALADVPGREGTSPSPTGRSATAAGTTPLVRRLGLLAWTEAYVLGLGLGLAAVQLLPLTEMALGTYRESQPDYAFATNYALPVPNLITLLFPYFFRGEDSRYWSLWSQWETALYVGIVPLALGIAGARRLRDPRVLYFVLLSAGGLWLAFASYAPVDLHQALWSLPGLSGLRAPGRYTLLFVLAWSVLAAFGLSSLQNLPEGSWRRRLLPALALATAGIVITGAAILGMGALRAALVADLENAARWIGQFYLAMRHHQEGLGFPAVYEGLLHTLSITTPRTALALLLLLIAGLLLGGVRLGWPNRFPWHGALVASATIDLLAFSNGFHHKLSLEKLSVATPAIQFLMSQPGPSRVFVPAPASAPSFEPDRLVPFRLEDLGGYSSLEQRENFTYWGRLEGTQNRLLDLANVRYVVYPVHPARLPLSQEVPFDPERPLMVGSKDSAGGFESFSFSGQTAHALRLLTALTHAWTVPQDAVVAELRVVPTSGEAAVVQLRAGVDLAEWAYDRPDAVGKIQHRKPDNIAFRRPDFYLLTGERTELYLFYSEHPLPAPMSVDRVEIRYTNPLGSIELYGLGLYNSTAGQTTGAIQKMRPHFRKVFADAEAEVFENTRVFPRAYVVPGAQVAPPELPAISAMLYTPFDPTREVMLEGPEGQRWARAAPAGAEPGGPKGVEIVQEGAEGVHLRASAPGGGFLTYAVSYQTGWRAWVNGQEAPVLQANHLFQAVPLPPGEHDVVLRYEPPAVKLGLAITLLAAALCLAVAVAPVLRSVIMQRR